ncbi:hypothetical protein A2U01_0110438, partial [Trifolium medium]|nr:hypothetical protein [Trifolium medium]
PEALPARHANTPARRAKDRSYSENSVSSFQGNHNNLNCPLHKSTLGRCGRSGVSRNLKQGVQTILS